jgi:hypothetical protein
MSLTFVLRSRSAVIAATLTLLLVLGTSTPTSLASATGSDFGPGVTTSYRNPTSRNFADTFADPSLIRGKDGWWYSYGTSDPLRAGDQTPRRIPIARSADLVSWEYVRDAFTANTVPTWAASDAGLWAPDIRYVDGQYRLYYVVTQTTVTDEPNDNAIGMATAPSPVGPWTDSGAPVIAPRHGLGQSGDFLWTFDPSVVTNTDGSQWMFYGSYYGGVFAQRLDAEGRTPIGPPTMVAVDNKFEGAYAVHRNGYWYLFASTANCCAGPTTGYSVQVGRSTSITGPYVDAQGAPLNQSRAGGTPVLNQNGNSWVGTGHNAIATDLAGQDWIVYHAIDRADPYLDGTEGINQRPMLEDRLDWIAGWPVVRGDRGPSDTPTVGPVTGGYWTTDFSGGIPAGWTVTPGWSSASDPQSGRYAAATRAGVLLSRSTMSSVRVEADLRSATAAYGLRVDLEQSVVQAVIDPLTRSIRLQQRRNGRLVASAQAQLPAGFVATAWHSVSLQLLSGTAVAAVSNARLGDPQAMLSVRLHGSSRVGASGALAEGRGVGVDNLSVLPPTPPVTRRVVEHVPHRLDPAGSDEFSGSSLDAGWSWVRRDAAATASAGSLVWPTEAADLTGNANDAGVLLRSPGPGAWTVETKLSIDLGTDSVRNFQQAGLVAYVGDDLFARFDHVAIFNTRQTEFGMERPYAGRLSYGGTLVGPPASTTWLRLTHHIDPVGGEHEIRAWSSRDGRNWVKGGVWTLPAGSDVKVGLVSHGGAGATARFDYFRLFR